MVVPIEDTNMTGFTPAVVANTSKVFLAPTKSMSFGYAPFVYEQPVGLG